MLFGLSKLRRLGATITPPAQAITGIETVRVRSGRLCNHQRTATGTTSVTAAAMVLLRQLESQGDSMAAGRWLRHNCYRHGGFLANPAAPLPDLLSTATALHAMAQIGYPLAPIKNECLDFIQAHWHDSGGFFAHLADPFPDCEYTFYGLLALGSLHAGKTGTIS